MHFHSGFEYKYARLIECLNSKHNTQTFQIYAAFLSDEPECQGIQSGEFLLLLRREG